MLPSTGLFKSIVCPYFFGGDKSSPNGVTCHRPYCHFKHVKKDELDPISQTLPAPEYTPAPKLLKLSCDPVGSLAVHKKKKKLEYRPDKPELQYTKSSRLKHSANISDVAPPIYVPSSSVINLDNCNEELEELTEIFEEQLSEENAESFVRENGVDDKEYIELKYSPTKDVEKHEEIELKFTPPEKVVDLEENVESKFSPHAEVEHDEIIIKSENDDKKSDISKEFVEEKLNSNEKQSSVTDDVGDKIKTENTDKPSKKKKTSSSNSNKNRHREERRNSTSSTSSSRHKHKSNSKDKSTNSKDRSGTKDSKSGSHTKTDGDKQSESDVRHKQKVKEKSSDKELASTSTSSKSKSSSHSKHTASSSTSSDPKHKKHNKSNVSSSSSQKHISSSSSSSLSKKDKSSACIKSKEHKSKDHKPKSSSSSSSRTKSLAATTDEVHLKEEPVELFATSEADIMKECEMIYDQLEQEFATLNQNKNLEQAGEQPQNAALKRKSSLDEEEQSTAAGSMLPRKRVAYENADKLTKNVPAIIHKPNHVRNAMQAIYNRKETLRKKQEEDASAAEVALREAEEKVREANEALRKVKAQNLTPLIPKSYLTPPARMNSRSHIMPVANILALERAKKRVEEFKAEKRLSFTPAQTTKSLGRLAHKPTVASTKVEPERKPKPPVLECTSTKISFNLRMQYYEIMVKHCLLIYPNEIDAYERAQTEELHVFKKCNTPVIYKSSCMLAINKLRKEAADSGNKPDCSNKIVSHEVILAGKLANTTSWSVQKKMKTESTLGGESFDKLPCGIAYDMVYELRLTEEQLVSNGYPRTGKRPGTATITYWKPLRRPNETERYCSRCGKVFSLSMYDEVCVDECNYHPKSTGYRRGFADSQHRCCQQPAGTPGCTYGNYHVSDYFDVENLTGYVSTIDKESNYVPTKKDIYALDCEMCYTTHGIELTRVTVVDINARTVYDALVKPDNKIVDYNTIYSGITEKMLENETRTLRDVQAILMSMFHSKTILVGHSLESDLKALKLIHSVVIDTSVLFPHKMGPPKKRALKTLCIENLKRIIQENEAGHDSAEDAEVCIQLVKFYLRNKIS